MLKHIAVLALLQLFKEVPKVSQSVSLPGKRNTSSLVQTKADSTTGYLCVEPHSVV